MQGNDEKPIKGKGTYNFSEYPEPAESSSQSMVIIEDSRSVPLSRNERPLGGKVNYGLPPEETPSYGSQLMSFEEAPEETGEEEIGPLEKRIESKIWKTRTKAYEELSNELKNSKDLLESYAASVAKFISDTHPGAQEKGLEVFQVYLLISPSLLLPHSENLVRAIIEKCIPSAKASIKSTSSALVLDFFSEHFQNTEGFIQGLLHGLNNKNLKVQSAAISTINSAMSAFGVRLVPFKPFLIQMEKLAGNSNPVVRGEALNFYKEAYRWARELILPSVSKLKKPQQDELQKAFEEITEIPSPLRYMKHEEAKIHSQGEKPNKSIDVYDMADAKDIFAKYNDKWADSVLEMEKWTEKKQALELLCAEANYPKIAEKSPAALVGMAKRLINDANVNVMLQTLKMIGLLAKGQRKYFEQYAKQFFPVFLTKLKDKKTQVVQETFIGLENLLYSIALDQVNDDIKEAMEDKTPTLKINVTVWLCKVCTSLSSENVLKSVKNFAMMGKKNADDSIAEVRNESFKLIGLLLKKFPEIVSHIVKDFPQAKLKRVEDIAEGKSEVEEEVKKVPNKPELVSKIERPAVKEKPGKKNEIPKKEIGKVKENPKGPDEEIGNLITSEEAENVMSVLLPGETLEKLKETSWKDKLEGLQEVMKWVSENEGKVAEITDALFIFIKLSVKDWKENNVNVIRAAFEIINTLSSLTIISKRSAYIVLTAAALEKLSEPKLIDCYTTCLLSLSQGVGPKFIVSSIIKNTSDCNKPKVVSECLSIIAKVIIDFGVHKITLKEVIDYAKTGLNQANPIIKKSAQALTIKIYSYIGNTLLPLLSDIKEATLKALQEDFSKTEILTATSFKSVRGEEDTKFDPKKVLDDAIPRNNISSKITQEILKDLSDNNWKVRKEALDAIEDVLEKSGKRVLPIGLDDLFKLLKARLEDPNKSIVRSTLTLMVKMAECLGAEAKVFNRVVVPGLLSNLGDKQNLLRQDALVAIEKWAAETGAESIVNYAAEPLMLESPELRNELLNWLLAHKDTFAKCDMKPFAPSVLNCLQDRAANIRNSAEILFGEVVECIGFDSFQIFLKDIKPAVLNTLKAVFDKYRKNEPVLEVQSGQKNKPKPMLKKSASKIPNDSEIKTPRNKKVQIDARVADPGDKEKRLDLDSRYKWSVEEIRPDYLDKLKDQIRAGFSQDLSELMLNPDFKKQASAAGFLLEIVKSQEGEIISYLDLLLKWCWIELIVSTNTQIYKAVLELDLLIISKLESIGYQLNDVEAGLILPVLCDKSGQNNAVFRNMIRKILHQSCKVYPADKVFGFVVSGASSKNSKSKFECIEELAALIIDYGIEIASPKDVKFLSKQVNSSDNNVRSAAVVTLSEIFKVIGEKIWTLIGDVPDKVRSMLDQRFRTVKVKIPDKPPIEIAKRNPTNFRKTQEFGKISFDPEYKNEEIKEKEIILQKNSDLEKFNLDLEKKNLDFERKNFELEKKNNEILSKVINKHVEAFRPVELPYKAPDLQSIAEKLSSLEKVVVFEEEDRVELMSFDPDAVRTEEILKNEKNLIVSKKSSEDLPKSEGLLIVSKKFSEDVLLEEPLIKEESKSRNIHELRNALKEKKQQNFRTSMQFPELKPFPEPVSEILSIIQKLETSDTSLQVDALESLNSTILENLPIHEQELKKHAHTLCKAIVSMINIFISNAQGTLEFYMYFFKVVHKLFCIEFIAKSLMENELSQVCESLLQGLILEGLEKAGENGEGEVIAKSITASIMKILELALPTEVFEVFLNLLVKYKTQNLGKMNGILIRCLLKLTRALAEILHEVNLEKLLFGIDKYLTANNGTTDEMGTKAMKTILNELVKLIGEDIWVPFQNIQTSISENSLIENWIHLLLGTSLNLPTHLAPLHANSNLGSLASSHANSHANSSTNFHTEPSERLEEIMRKLGTPGLYSQAFKDLSEMIHKSPDLELTLNFSNLSEEIREKLSIDLLELKKNSKKPENKPYNFSEMQSRLALMKQKYGIESENPSNPRATSNKSEGNNFAALKSRIQKFSKK